MWKRTEKDITKKLWQKCDDGQWRLEYIMEVMSKGKGEKRTKHYHSGKSVAWLLDFLNDNAEMSVLGGKCPVPLITIKSRHGSTSACRRQLTSRWTLEQRDQCCEHQLAFQAGEPTAVQMPPRASGNGRKARPGTLLKQFSQSVDKKGSHWRHFKGWKRNRWMHYSRIWCHQMPNDSPFFIAL